MFKKPNEPLGKKPRQAHFATGFPWRKRSEFPMAKKSHWDNKVYNKSFTNLPHRQWASDLGPSLKKHLGLFLGLRHMKMYSSFPAIYCYSLYSKEHNLFHIMPWWWCSSFSDHFHHHQWTVWVRRWLMRPILARKVLEQWGQDNAADRAGAVETLLARALRTSRLFWAASMRCCS